MIMLFLDLERAAYVTGPGQMVGGKSGGILNQVLLDELMLVAKEHNDKVNFVYLDGLKHEDQMRSLGLFGGAARLPSIAINTREGLQVPFPEELAVNKDTLLQYVADFISGKLRSSADVDKMTKKALQSSSPINQKNKAKRKEKKAAAEIVRGISEEYADGSSGDKAIYANITAENFEEELLEGEIEGKDVVLMLHAETGMCPSCGHFAVYFKKMAERFAELNIPSLVIARMDVTAQTPPSYLKLMPESPLPVMVLLPANAKLPPWNYYSGIGKVGPMMKWIHATASVPFTLPHLPHLEEDQIDLYKEQMREREKSLATKKKQADEAEAAMDAQREESNRKLALKEEGERKKKEEKEAEVEEEDPLVQEAYRQWEEMNPHQKAEYIREQETIDAAAAAAKNKPVKAPISESHLAAARERRRKRRGNDDDGDADNTDDGASAENWDIIDGDSSAPAPAHHSPRDHFDPLGSVASDLAIIAEEEAEFVKREAEVRAARKDKDAASKQRRLELEAKIATMERELEELHKDESTSIGSEL